MVAGIFAPTQGLNWFGFETSATMVGGLWAGSTSLTQDFSTIVWRMQLLGLNAVRLPFSFQARVYARVACMHAEPSTYISLD